MRSWRILFGLAFVSLAACTSRQNDDTGAASGGMKSEGGAGAQNTAGTSGASEGGAGGNGNPKRLRGAIVESSWDTVLSLPVTNAHGAPNAQLCTAAKLTMHLTPNGTGLDAITGVDGNVGTGHFTRNADQTNAYVLDVPLWIGNYPPSCYLEDLSVSELLLDAWDDDGDGIADKLEGTGKASGRYLAGDVAFAVDLAVTGWSSLPDQTIPTLIGQASAHPLDVVTIRASEPLALSTELELSDGSGLKIPLTPTANNAGAFGTFASSIVLPFQTTLTITGHGTDLAGLSLDLAGDPRTTPTLEDPGLFLQDGFETPPVAMLQNSARVVSSVGDLPAISGAQSLFVEFPSSTLDGPFSTSTLHLQRAPGTKSLRLAAQILVARNIGVGAFHAAEVGVIGGSKRSYVDLKTSENVIATGDASWPYAGDVQEVSVDLADEGPDVVVRIAKPWCPNHPALCPSKVALLIDDVRIE